MIDPVLTLSFSLHSNKGVYALLLGSGISRPAGIPTGWEITEDLIKKIAQMQKADYGQDPTKWYAETFGEEPDYSRILSIVAKTPVERSQLLKSYFEPSEEEKTEKLKLPTDAHKAIANLVAEKYIKVIITTNFDRLLEKALEEKGITPIVIDSPDAALGALPLVHTQCTIIKLHGDYLDTRIKNTPKELSSYHKNINKLLDRIFDEFGLLICGWSGEWDIALCKAIQRAKSHRFTTYWLVKGILSENAKILAENRQAEIIKIQSADSFFVDLSEKLSAIDEFDKPHPLSSKIAAETFKRYLEDEKSKIRMHDLVNRETDKLIDVFFQSEFSAHEPNPTKDEYTKRVKKIETQVELLQAIYVVGGFWGDKNTGKLFTKSYERLSNSIIDSGGYNIWVQLQYYPSLILLFSASLAALASENYLMLASLLLEPTKNIGEQVPLLQTIYPSYVIERSAGQSLPGMENRKTPASDHLVDILQEPLKDFISDKNILENEFDYLEYLIALINIDYQTIHNHIPWGPEGRFIWRQFMINGRSVISNLQREINENNQWKPLSFGFFGGSSERAKKAQETYIAQIGRSPLLYP